MTKECQNCKVGFEITDDDLRLYNRIKVPPPTWCPECRLQRRLAWRNERALYQRRCDLCKKDIIAMYPEGTVFPVYCRGCWYSDTWDELSYGKDYNSNKPFFEQFKELQNSVPRINLMVDNSVNCDYTNQIADCKNCYLISSGSDNEDCLYSFRILYSKNVVDGYLMLRNELCYECIECMEVSRLKFVEDSVSSLDLAFCYDVRGSQNCFLSSNLRNSSYVFENKKRSKEEFNKLMSGIDMGSYNNIQLYKDKFLELKRKSIHRFMNTKNAVNSTGHTISYAKNCHFCFNVANVENLRYVLFVNDAKDAMDVNNGCCTMELAYEVCTMGVNASNIKFSVDAWPEVRNLEYCDSGRNGSHDLFGCISVRKKQYCILNKQYTKEKYLELISKIQAQMTEVPYVDKKGRIYKYGEFFPAELSPFPYGDSVAYDYYPLTKEEAAERGYPWRDPIKKDYNSAVKPQDLPDHIDQVDDTILNAIIECEHEQKCNERCTKAFRIIPMELEFYRKINVPLPRLSPNCRHYQRHKQRNPLTLWHRRCECEGQMSKLKGQNQYKNTADHIHHKKDEHCQNEFETTYAPERLEIVYCEACYLREVV